MRKHQIFVEKEHFEDIELPLSSIAYQLPITSLQIGYAPCRLLSKGGRIFQCTIRFRGFPVQETSEPAVAIVGDIELQGLSIASEVTS